MVDEYYDYGATGVNDIPKAESGLVLYQNFPNPVQTITSIGFQLPGSGDVCIEVLNGNGKIIDIPLKNRMGGGAHMVNWNSGKVPSGSYFYRIHFGGLIRTKQMIVIH
jgi:hypothetical protein